MTSTWKKIDVKELEAQMKRYTEESWQEQWNSCNKQFAPK
jgi:hypothetical protein